MGTITFYARGRWGGSGQPSASGFQQEASANGWNTDSWQFNSTGYGGSNPNDYEIRFRVLNIGSNYSAEQIRDVFAALLYHYFNDVVLQVTSLSGVSGGTPQGGNAGASGTYTVVAGDTLSRIAARFGMSLAALLALNPQIHNANVINVGQVINISGTPHAQTIPVLSNINPNNGTATVTHTPVTGNVPTATTGNWFDRTFFTGAGALTGVGIGVLVVLGAVVVTRNR